MRHDHDFARKHSLPHFPPRWPMLHFERMFTGKSGVLVLRHCRDGREAGRGWRVARVILAVLASWLLTHAAQAQWRTPPAPTEFAMDELAIDNDAEILGRHVARLHHAARVCGGGFDEKRVDPFGEASERLRSYRAYTDAYNNEARHLPGYQRFRGLEPTCQRLYAFYGPRGSCVRHAYNPLRDQFGNRSRPQGWLKGLRRTAGH